MTRVTGASLRRNDGIGLPSIFLRSKPCILGLPRRGLENAAEHSPASTETDGVGDASGELEPQYP
jgi:hypothetical protein